VVVGRAGGRRDTPRRTGNEGRNVVAVATPSCTVGRLRHAPSSRRAASGPSHPLVAPLRSRAVRREGGAQRGGPCPSRAAILNPRARGHRLFGAPFRDVSIIPSDMRRSICKFLRENFRPASKQRRVKIDARG